MINKEGKSIFDGEKMSIVIISATLILCLVILFSCKSVVTSSSSVNISNLKVAKNKAEEYYFNRQYDKAIEEYEKDGQDDEWPMYKVKMAEIYSVKGDKDKSNNILEESVINRYALIDSGKLSDYDIEDDRELTNLVVFTFFMNGEYAKALEYGELFLAEDKNNNMLQRTMISIYMSNNEIEKAKAIVNNYTLDTTSSYDLALYARMNMLINDYDKGFKYLKEAWDLNKDEIKVYDCIAQITAYDNDTAIEKLTKLQKDNPKELCYKAWLTKYYSMFENTTMEASKLLGDIYDEDLGDTAFKTVEAKIYQHSKMDTEAEKVINGIIEDKQESYIGYHAAAWYYEEKQNYNKAIDYCNKSIALNRDYADNYIFLILDIMSKSNNKEAAEPYIRIVLEKEPFNYNIILKIADYYWNVLENSEKAYEYYNMARIINPSDAKIYYNIAKIDLSEDNISDSIEELKQCVKLQDSSAIYHRTLGTVYLNEGNKKEAIKEIRRAYSIDKSDIKTLNNAGCYYISLESNISRGLINLEAAYKGITNETDEETKIIIKDNYEKAKLLYDEYSNFDGSEIPIPSFELFY